MKERLFKKKKNVLNVNRSLCILRKCWVMSFLHVSFVHVSIHVAMNMFGMCM